MKKLRIALLVFTALALFTTVEVSAQGRFGKDSADCVNNLNFYQDFLRQGNMTEAYSHWIQALKFCPPKVSQNLYINGRKIMLSVNVSGYIPPLRFLKQSPHPAWNKGIAITAILPFVPV